MNRKISFMLIVISFPSLSLAESLNLTLEGTLQRASELSQQVQIAKTGSQVASAKKDLEKSPFGPHLSIGTGIAGTYGFPLSIEGAAPSLFNVNYIQTLYDRNQRKLADAAEVLVSGSESELQLVQQKAALEAGRIFLDLRNQRNRHQYYQTQLESLGKTKEIIAARVEAGVAQPRELTKAKLELARTKVTLTTNEKNLQLLEEQLRQATGVAPGVSLMLDSEDQVESTVEWSEETLLLAALEKDPALRQLRFQEKSSEVAEEGLTGWFRPVVNLVGRYDLFSTFNNYDKYFNNFQRNNVTVGFSIQVPLMNPSLNPEKRRLQALQDEARIKIKLRSDQIRTETQSELANLQVIKARAEVATLEAQLARENLQVAQANYDEGKIPLASLEELRREESSRWLQYLDIKLEEEKNALNLRNQAGLLLK